MNVMSLFGRPIKIIVTALVLLSSACKSNQTDDGPTVANTSRTRLEVLPTEDIDTPEEAFKALQAGNERYENGRFEHVHIKRVTGQPNEEPIPFVAILTCTDFKIPPEILFDLDKNNILLLQTAGNIADENVLTAIQSSLESKKLKLVLVLGHNNCGAIKKVLNNDKSPQLLKLSAQLAEAAPANGTDTLPLIDRTAMNNIRLTVTGIASKNAKIDTLSKEGNLQIKGAFYSANSGKVIYDSSF